MQTTTIDTDHRHVHFADGVYDAWVAGMQRQFDALVRDGTTPLFITDADDLWDVYLDSFPEEHRQYHNCSCCKAFIRRFGSLVVVDESGLLEPVMWFETFQSGGYSDAVNAMHDRVKRAKIVREFTTNERNWGTAQSGGFSHFAIRTVARQRRYGETPASERMRTINTALVEFSPGLLDVALQVLEADAVNRAERFVAPLKWLRRLHDIRGNRNLMWREVAAAPEGYVHPRSSVTGTLLEDIKAGMDFEDVRRRFNAKMHPLSYQRPQATPSLGTIRQAEKLVEELGIKDSLERRFARIEDLELAWTPQQVEQQTPTGFGVFDHLKPGGAAPKSLRIPPKAITWEKFCAKVLLGAKQMQVRVPNHGNFTGITYAVNPEAPSLFKWEGHAAWFCFHGGSYAERWSLVGGEYRDITGVWKQPQGYPGSVLLISGAACREKGTGNALFPECLKGELHGVRSVIEAYSKKATLHGADEATACGLVVVGAVIRVDGIDYQIDRLD